MTIPRIRTDEYFCLFGWLIGLFFCFFVFCFLFFFLGSHSQHMEVSRLRIKSELQPWPMPQPQQRRIWTMSATYTTAHGNASSLTHEVFPEIEPATSWLLLDSFLLRHNGNARTDEYFSWFSIVWFCFLINEFVAPIVQSYLHPFSHHFFFSILLCYLFHLFHSVLLWNWIGQCGANLVFHKV